eukprot:m51a1_g9885 hypothetical protein (1005) ;mRNA; r:21512-25394
MASADHLDDHRLERLSLRASACLPSDTDPGDDYEPALGLNEQLRRVARAELYEWRAAEYPLALPPSSVALAGIGDADLGALARPDDDRLAAADLADVARGPGGALRRLSAEQRASVWARGEFSVASRAYEGQAHVWRLSGLLQKGTRPSLETLRGNLAAAAALLWVALPDCLVGRAFSVRRGLAQLLAALANTLALVVGFVDRVCALDVGYQLRLAAKRRVLAPFFPDGRPPPRQADRALLRAADGTQLSLRYVYARRQLGAALQGLVPGVVAAWATDKHAFIDGLLREGALADPQEMADECVRELNRRVLAAVRAPDSPVPPDLREDVAVHLRAKLEAASCHRDLVAAVSDAEQRVRAALQEKNPIRGRCETWLRRQVEASSRRVEPALRSAAWEKLRAVMQADAAYTRELYSLVRHMEFREHEEAGLRKQLEGQLEPQRVFTWGFYIWRPSKWHVRETSPGSWSCERWDYVEVKSSWLFWRWANFFVSMACFMKNTLFGLIFANMLYGPLGLHALFRRSKFSRGYYVDYRTGKLLANEPNAATLCSRVADLWASISQSRSNFERTPDTGLIGKGVTRLFNLFWNYVVKGLVGTALVVLLQPPLTVANVMATVLLVLGTVLYIPVASLAVCLFNLLVYDTSHTQRGFRVLPLVSEFFLRLFVLGLGQLLLALVSAVLVLPAAALAVAVFSVGRWVSRRCYDSVMYLLVVLPRARIPASNSFLAHRVQGPGLSRAFFRQIDPAVAVTCLQVALERLELDTYESETRRSIEAPLAALTAFGRSVLQPCGLELANGSPLYRRLARTQEELLEALGALLARRREAMPSMGWARSGNIRLSQEDLNSALRLCEALVKDFVPQRVLSRIEPGRQAEFWRSHGDVAPGKWGALTAHLLGQTFGEGFLTPLEETDKALRVQMQSVRVREFFRMVADSNPIEDADYVSRLHVGARAARAQPRLLELSAGMLYDTGDEQSDALEPTGMLGFRALFPDMASKPRGSEGDSDYDD